MTKIHLQTYIKPYAENVFQSYSQFLTKVEFNESL